MAKTIVVKGADFSQHYIEQVAFGNVPCTGISLDSSAETLVNTTDTVTLTATVTPANTTDIVIWTSSNTDIASVVDGVVSATGIGTATITATCGEYSATCTVTCNGIVDFKYVVGSYVAATDSRDYVEITSTTASDGIAVGESTGVLAGTYNETGDGWIYPIIIPKNATVIKCRCLTQYWGIGGIFFTQSDVASSVKTNAAKKVKQLTSRADTGWGDKTYNGQACWGNDITLPTDVTYDSVVINLKQYGSAAASATDAQNTHIWFEV